jgi:hypothetical protein
MSRKAVALRAQPRRLSVNDVWDLLGFLAFGSSVLFILALLLQ